jgi:hypothetical protein
MRFAIARNDRIALIVAVLHRGVLVALVTLALLVPAGTAGGALPFRTALVDTFEFAQSGSNQILLDRAAATGASVIRIPVSWISVAPAGTELPHDPGEPRRWAPPAGFDAANPADPNYRWSGVDALVGAVSARGLAPLLTITTAPLWAEDAESSLRARSSWYVDPQQLNAFALATARRYSGSFAGFPRVRYFQAWTEPNASNLGPQVTIAPSGPPIDPATILSADLYRELVNSFADGVHSVHRDNVVVAGGLSPFTNTVGFITIGPLAFMRKLLCLSPAGPPRPVCAAKIRFDAWSTHPYTSGGPNHHAVLPEDVSIGDLPEMKAVLDAAVRAQIVVASRPVEFWATEFSWDSNPPDPAGVPAQVLPRWVAEGFYRMWRSGISLVTWFKLRDAPQTSLFQSGLYYRGTTIEQDRPKPELAAFRFPFVAFPSGVKRIFLWGRTPGGRPATVLVEQRSGRRWKRIGVVRTDVNGILQARLLRHGTGTLVRASTFAGAKAVPFSLRPTVDIPVDPFGSIPVKP